MRSQLEKAVRGVLCSGHPEIATAYLFGSQARGEARPASDVDLAILLADEPPSTLDGPATRLAAALERRLNQPVDIVVLNRAPADLVHRVLRDGVLVCENDPSLRVRFEVAKRNEYFDLLPALKRYRRTQAA